MIRLIFCTAFVLLTSQAHAVPNYPPPPTTTPYSPPTTTKAYTPPPTTPYTPPPTTPYSPPTTTKPTYHPPHTTTAYPTPTYANGCVRDGNLEIQQPPLLNDNETRVIFFASHEYMQVSLTVPKFYETLQVSFLDAQSDGGAFDSENPNANSFWTVDDSSDLCNNIVVGRIPWDDFRRSLGGVTEERTKHAVWFDTSIEITATFDLTLTPKTMLLAKNFDQEHTRTVAIEIPFKVHFDLDLELWGLVDIKSNELRVASALLESSVFSVNPDANPIATAELEFVTVIPLPTILNNASITVDDADLSYGLTVREIESKRDCVYTQGFCNQHWRVHINPKKCNIDGQYTVTVHGTCHPDAKNCNEPWPATTDIVLDVTSDDFCGVTQKVDVKGSLSLYPTKCNKYMRGQIVVSSKQGAAINNTRITELFVSPTLINPGFITIFDESDGTSLLGFNTNLVNGHTLEFSFQWLGDWLRCDVIAHVGAKVLVEFRATRPLLLDVTFDRENGVVLQESQGTSLQMSDSIMVSAAESDGNGVNPGTTTGTGGGNPSTPEVANSACSLSLSSMSPLVLGLLAGMAGIMLVVIAGAAVYVRRRSAAPVQKMNVTCVAPGAVRARNSDELGNRL